GVRRESDRQSRQRRRSDLERRAGRRDEQVQPPQARRKRSRNVAAACLPQAGLQTGAAPQGARKRFSRAIAREQKERGNHMEERLYDLIFIVRPATPEDEIKKVLSAIEHTCAEKGGKIEKAEQWGTRKLAYRVAKHREGIYFYQQIRTAHSELIAEL